MSKNNEISEIEHPSDNESYADSLTRIFQEMDFVGQ